MTHVDSVLLHPLTLCSLGLIYKVYTIPKLVYLSTYTKVNSNWIRNLNLRQEMQKLLEENMANALLDTGVQKVLPEQDFSSTGPSPKHQQMGLRVTKQFLQSKRTISRVNSLQNRENLCKLYLRQWPNVQNSRTGRMKYQEFKLPLISRASEQMTYKRRNTNNYFLKPQHP